jgi:hypothetical protein
LGQRGLQLRKLRLNLLYPREISIPKIAPELPLVQSK